MLHVMKMKLASCPMSLSSTLTLFGKKRLYFPSLPEAFARPCSKAFVS